jgi:uncharacterized protein (DUF697 family)
MTPETNDETEQMPGASALTGKNADRIVQRYMVVALAVGLVPLPLVDMAALTALQLRLLSRLAKEYKVEFSKQLVTSLVGSLVGAGGSVLAGQSSTRLILQFVMPPAGWVAGAASTAVFAGASTYALGKVFIQHFDSGGTFLTFDPEKVREYFGEQFKVGSAEVRESFAGVRP